MLAGRLDGRLAVVDDPHDEAHRFEHPPGQAGRVDVVIDDEQRLA